MAKGVTVTRRSTKDPFPPFPMTFVPEGTDVTSKEQLDALFLDLEERKIASVAALEKWLLDWSELQAFLSEAESRRYIEMTCHTDDEGIQRRFLDFQNVILPFVKPRWQHLKTIYAASPFRSKLDKKRYHVFDRAVVNEIEIYRDENVPLESKEAELVTKWQSVTGAMTVSWDGQDRTMPQMAALLDETDRSLRERAWRAMYDRRLKDRAEIDRLYDEMIRLRVTMSRNAGFHNYRDYMFRVRGRFDYTPDDCRAFHDAVEEFVVPVLRRLHDRRKRDLDVGTLRPWDLNVDPAGAAPLRPFKDVKDLVQGVRDVYHKISPDLARLFEGIRDRGNLDLDSRKGKAPGGYQSTLDVQRVPFIFMNAAGVNRDVMTLLHEGGHAFHAILARTEPLVFYRSAPLEFCEVASMGMEAIGVKHLDVFYPKEADAARARREYFEGIIKIFPWIASIDAFQHWVYLHPGHSRKDREKAWLDLRRKFKGGDDWTGLENEHATSWHLQMHPFCVPFYYIEYAFAQVGALQVWQNARKDTGKALASYREGLALGGSRTLPELFKATGLKFGLDRKILKPLIKAVEAEL